MSAQGGGSTRQAGQIPIVVDLDGTLILSDVLHESAVNLLRRKPLKVLLLPFWLMRGKARMKSNLADEISVDVEHLPLNREFLDWLREQKSLSRPLVLCTGSHEAIAREVSRHLGIFEDAMGSDAEFNRSGPGKRSLLEGLFGHRGYDYAGNAPEDVEVWRGARRAIVVNASAATLRGAGDVAEVEKIFAGSRAPLKVWWNVFRFHQWLKNLLLFVPLLAAHRFSDINGLLSLCVAFAAMSICASGVYVANDLLDAESDRKHPRKKNRPFAAGAVTFKVGTILSPLLVGTGVALSLLVGPTFALCVAVYLVLTACYSMFLKRYPLVDCLTLAALYTIRLIAGAAAVEVALSFWLLAFSAFLFLSLAILKRVTELQAQAEAGNDTAHGRGFLVTDAPVLQMMGVTSGYASILVLALYVNSDAVTRLYRHPEMIWSAVPLMLLWISWVWLKTHRGEMHDDPIVFSVRDRTSLAIGLLVVLIFAAASFL